MCLAITMGLLVEFSLPADPASSSSQEHEELFRMIRNSAWAVYLRESGGMKAICSAIAFKTSANTTTLLTAGHCFVGEDLEKTDFLVTQDHRRFVNAKVVKSGLSPKKGIPEGSQELTNYTGDDWAIIEVEIGNQQTIPLGKSSDLVIGENLLIVGLPFGMDFLAVLGIVGSTDISLSQYVWNHYYGANAFVAAGNSGSGVVSAKQKAIVGVVNAAPGSQSSMMIFMPVDKLPKEVR